MDISQISLWWLIGFIASVVLLLTVILLRNKAAKTDSVNYTEKDTIAQSVSITPSKHAQLKQASLKQASLKEAPLKEAQLKESLKDSQK